MSIPIELLKQLIACPSITPHDAHCQDIIGERLKALGFQIEFLHFGEVTNLWARRGTGTPLLVLAGHTDVVPPGPLSHWTNDPFTPTERDGFLYGRGAADMKSGLAALLIAAERFIQQYPDHPGSIAFLITSDEEGPSINGTKRVMAELIKSNVQIDYCIIGEASSDKTLGDQIRVGRRGSLSAKLTIFGKQGHVAFPELAQNPIHLAIPILKQLTNTIWDKGNEFFPATSFQISNIQAGTGASNVIPGAIEISFNFRFSSASSAQDLQSTVLTILEKEKINFDLQWDHSGDPFLTTRGKLIACVQESIRLLTGLDPILSTGGGTSDGRFIAPTGAEVIELGPINASVHQANEHVKIKDVELLTDIYQLIIQKLLIKK